VVSRQRVVVDAVEARGHVRILITGARGQLGTELMATCTAAGDDVVGIDLPDVDVTSRDRALAAITSVQPDAVIHAAAWTAVDACESAPDEAYAANALASRHVAEGCRLAGSHLVALSTDYVFDGTKSGPYVEWDEPNPQSAYGRSKLAGEREVLAGLPGAAVARTAWLCGAHGPNVVKTVLRLAAASDGELAFVDDQVGCPTFTSDLAPMLRRLAVARAPGTFHVTNSRAVSWYGFVREVLAAAGQDPGRVRPITTAELDPPLAAPRPANSVLDGPALRGAGFDPLPDFAGPLGRLVKELLDA
jgi:dTDP-4-dehydrorhamnose reductase